MWQRLCFVASVPEAAQAGLDERLWCMRVDNGIGCTYMCTGCAAVDSFIHPMEAARKMYKSLVRFRAKFDAENK